MRGSALLCPWHVQSRMTAAAGPGPQPCEGASGPREPLTGADSGPCTHDLTQCPCFNTLASALLASLWATGILNLPLSEGVRVICLFLKPSLSQKRAVECSLGFTMEIHLSELPLV